MSTQLKQGVNERGLSMSSFEYEIAAGKEVEILEENPAI
jgi:hypothetical protein